MLYEVKVSYRTMNEEGTMVNKKEWYVIEHCDRFSEVEEKAFDNFDYDNFKDFDVTDIKRSRIKELTNTRDNGQDKVFMAELQDTFTSDDGMEKKIKYKVIFFSKNIDTAMSYITEYIKQDYNMMLVTLKETKFIDVF